MSDKATTEHAIERARAQARKRTAVAPKAAAREASANAFLIGVLERRLGSPIEVVTTRCRGLANELKGAVAVADRLMQRIQLGANRNGLKTWRGDVRDYARATLKAEALAVELQEQVGRTSGVVKALDDLSLDTPTLETDVAFLLQQFAEFLRDGLPQGATLRVDALRPCVVGVPRPIVVGMLSNAIDSALYNMLEAASVGRILLRAWVVDATTVVVEVTDDGAPAAALLQTTSKDASFSDPRAVRLRQLRKRARRAGGDLTVQSNAGGNTLSLYLPLSDETALSSQSKESLLARPRRRRRVGPQSG
jgi:signal transduction histidine kinase